MANATRFLVKMTWFLVLTLVIANLILLSKAIGSALSLLEAVVVEDSDLLEAAVLEEHDHSEVPSLA